MAELAELHRLAQARIGQRTVEAMRATWPLLDRTALDATTATWISATVPIIGQHRVLSARVAASYLERAKAEALGDTAELVPHLATQIQPRAVATSLLVTGPIALKKSARNGIPFALALDRAFTMSSAAGMRHALNGGRSTIARTIGADPDAIGWRRVASGRACEFCSMLVGRGAVYREATAHFDAHDGCSCSAEPVWAA